MNAHKPQSVMRFVTLQTADQIVVQPSEARIGLIFCAAGAGYYAVSTQVLASANEGVIVNTNMEPFTLWRDRHGSIVCLPWHAFANAGPMNNVAIIEVYE